MDYRLIIFVLTGALVNVAFAQTRQYYFVITPLNWTDAQSFCRQFYTDLATIENAADVSAVISTTSNYTGQAWIGLYDELINSWIWSLNNSSYGTGGAGFRNCVEMLGASPNTGTLVADDCSLELPFICYNGTVNGTASFVKVKLSLNWTEAQRYCRENYVDLASIQNETENSIIANLTDGDNVWIGLHRDLLWSDGSTSVFTDWASGQLSSSEQHCVTTLFSDSGHWSNDNCSLSFPLVCYTAIPPNAGNFTLVAQTETSITLQWNPVNNNNVSFVLQFDGLEINITAPVGGGAVTQTVSSLTAGTKYTFTLFSVFKNVRSSGVNITAVTAPPNAGNFRAIGQTETSITLQWNPVNNNVSFILRFNGTETNIPAPVGGGAVTQTVSSLTAGTQYAFTLFSVFENVRSSGGNITAVTAPPNAENFRAIAQTETSITLQWNPVNNNVSFILRFNGTETNIPAAVGGGAVTQTVSSLTAGTQYAFTLFSLFKNIRSSGVTTTAVTASPAYYIVGLNIKIKAFSQLSSSDLNSIVNQLITLSGLTPQLVSLNIRT